MSVKFVLKQLNTWYYDKGTGAMDSQTVRGQTMAEYIYDQYYNKYGIGKIAEKKLRELVVTLLANRERVFTLELFSRFMGLSKCAHYTNNDLYFFYKVNQLFTFNDLFKQPNFLRREFFFDNTHLKCELCLQYLNLFLTGKISGDRLHLFIKRYHLLTAEENNVKVTEINLYKLNLKEMVVSTDRVYELVIQTFRAAKCAICLQLIARGIVGTEAVEAGNYGTEEQEDLLI